MDRAKRTQASYDRIAGAFLERPRDSSLRDEWMRRFVAYVPAAGLVADLGAGPCHLSAALRALGLRVISVDRSPEMLNVARDVYPGPRVRADLRQLPFRSASLAGVWANASLLHLERHELVPALEGIARALVSGGVLFLSLKAGSGEGYDTSTYGADAPRWFTYWEPADVDAALAASGLEIVAAELGATSAVTWIMRLARRI